MEETKKTVKNGTKKAVKKVVKKEVKNSKKTNLKEVINEIDSMEETKASKINLVEDAKTSNVVKTKKSCDGLLLTISLIIPLIGLLLYFVFKNKNKSKELVNKTLKCTIIGFCIYAFAAISFILPAPESGVEKLEVVTSTDVNAWLEDTKLSEPVVTIIGSSTCPHCQEYKPVISKLSNEYGFKLYFFEGDALSEEDAKTLQFTYDLAEYQGYVPFTFVMQNGKVIASTTGFESEEKTIEFLKTTEILKN